MSMRLLSRVPALSHRRPSALRSSVLRPTSILSTRKVNMEAISNAAASVTNAAASVAGVEPASKKARTSKVIGTHNGTFHADEALAVYMLRLTSAYRGAGLKRSRDPAVLDTCDIVVDVGGVYDEAIQRFDHHQRGFEEVFGNGYVTKLSSAGLVYKHFGQEIVADRLQLPASDEKVRTLWLKMYKEFIEAVDGIDNGVEQYIDEAGKPAKARYRSGTGLSSRVGHLNPAWNQPSGPEVYDAQFAKASELTGGEFLSRLDYYGNAWLPARSLVADALVKRFEADPSGQIIAFSTYLPWKEHLHELEQEHGIQPHGPSPMPLYVLYPDESGKWRVQAIGLDAGSFENRKPLPAAWRGLRDEELSRESGVPGCVFVHASGFIGGNATKEGALKMAQLALTL